MLLGDYGRLASFRGGEMKIPMLGLRGTSEPMRGQPAALIFWVKLPSPLSVLLFLGKHTGCHADLPVFFVASRAHQRIGI